MIKKSIPILITTILIFFVGCSPVVINDYFGIMMDPEYAEGFEIVSYNDLDGAVYKSNMYMNPLVYAYAELDKGVVIIKVLNMDETPIPINSNTDQFVVYNNDGEKFMLTIDREKYSVKESIGKNESVTFTLELPLKFFESIGTGDYSGFKEINKPDRRFFDYTEKQNDLDEVKKYIKYFEVTLDLKNVIILKVIP
ncbi:MAG: hypothetical protein JEY94_07905 [Melioribacteraceae bacterium]|nr:hypothetical protein [Melioribacteraceae bacterium]